MRMTCLIRSAALNWPETVALQDDTRRITFSEYDRVIVAMARRLKRLGISHGDRVAILARNSIEFAALIFASVRLGASTVLLNPRHGQHDWLTMLSLSHAKMLLLASEFRSQCGTVAIPTWIIDEDHPDSISRIVPVDDDVPRDVDTEQEATVVFSSGSSGQPKGVILTYVNHYFNAAGSNENIRLTTDDCWLLSLPLCHVGGLSILFRAALAGASAYLMPRFDTDDANVLVDSEVITHLSLVPTMLAELLRHRRNRPLPPSLDAILLGGAPASQRLIEQSKTLNLPLLTSYGLTEAGSQVCTLSSADSPDKLNTAGRPLKYREVKIVDADGQLASCGSSGEICVRGEVLFRGYLDNSNPFDADGWFQTGDFGYLDPEGYLTVLGRKDDMIISGGENIYPREIELVAETFTGVEECAVIGIADDKWGVRPVLFVATLAPDRFDLASLRNHLQRHLARIKMPDAVLAVDALPRLGIGKVDKGKLAELYATWAANHDSD
jgi:o-succinylbenzoate---CoA ligase